MQRVDTEVGNNCGRGFVAVSAMSLLLPHQDSDACDSHVQPNHDRSNTLTANSKAFRGGAMTIWVRSTPSYSFDHSKSIAWS